MSGHATDVAKHAAEQAQLEHLLQVITSADSTLAERAFAQLYDATVDRVISVARRITRDEHAALDVTAEVFVQAWREAARFDAKRGNVLAWLLIMARSRALDWYRRRQTQPVQFDTELVEACADAADHGKSNHDPLELLAATSEHSAVHAALAALGGRARQFVALAFLRGLTHQEIADVTGEPLGTVKTIIRRALRDMKQHLQVTAPQLATQFAQSA